MEETPKRRASDRVEDHNIIWKYIASMIAASSTTTMILLVIYFIYSDSNSSSPTASLDMYDKYKQYSSQYADQLYDRVGGVTDVVTSYKRTTDYRLDQHERMIESLQRQMSEQRATFITNSNTQNNVGECNRDNKNNK
jgi:hypothetical protein